MKMLFVVTLLLTYLVGQTNNIKARGLNLNGFNDWIIVTSGEQMSTLIKEASVGQTLNIRAKRDLTIGNLTRIPADVTLTIDMNQYALYTVDESGYQMSSGDKVNFQNEKIVSIGHDNEGVNVPDPSGRGYVSGKYNSAHGLFTTIGESYQTVPTLTFKNVMQDFATITNWQTDGRAFNNYGIQVQFSGQNYFNYPNTMLEFMRGAGFKVLDGKTELYGNNVNGLSFVQQSNGGKLGMSPVGVDVATGAELVINWQGKGNVDAIWPLTDPNWQVKSQDFHIVNLGTLKWNSTAHEAGDFFGNTRTDVPLTYRFGPNSKTLISVPGLFHFRITSDKLTALVEKDADFVYNGGPNDPIFAGSDSSKNATFVINSAKRVRFNTERPLDAHYQSILGPGVNFKLNADILNEQGYDLFAYNEKGGLVFAPSLYQGAYGIYGSFYGDLATLYPGHSVEGLHLPNRYEISQYQEASQLEFIKNEAQFLLFERVPDDSEMMFKYNFDTYFNDRLFPRNEGDLTMTFKIINTLSEHFLVQAHVAAGNFPQGMSFAWKDGLSTIDLNSINNTIFTSSNPKMEDDGYGKYQISYQADEGLLFKSKAPQYNPGAYQREIMWTLINGPE